MKCCVSTDVGTWTNWLTFEHDPDYSPEAGTGLLSPLSYERWYAEFYVGKIRRIRIRRCSDAWFYNGFIWFTEAASRRNTFASVALPMALYKYVYAMIWYMRSTECLHCKNVAARMVSVVRRCEHITPVLKDLHWLPASQRVVFQTALWWSGSVFMVSL